MDVVENLAKEFTRDLRENLTAEQWAEMVVRNRAEANPAICHSHDFLDANECMVAAFEALKIPMWADSGEMLDSAVDLWNGAWKIAKASWLED